MVLWYELVKMMMMKLVRAGTTVFDQLNLEVRQCLV